jgi:hypothetical protein
MAWAASPLAVAGLADAAAITVAAFRTVAAMLVTLLVSVAVSALFDRWARYLALLFHAANRTPTMTTKLEAVPPQEEAAAADSPVAEVVTSSEPPKVEGGNVFATVLLLYRLVHAGDDHGDQPAAALLVLHLSVTLSALLHM